MTRDDIIKLAREAGLNVIDSPEPWNESTKLLERFAALVAAAEREACAKTVEAMVHGNVRTCAASIRARGNDEPAARYD